MAVAAAAIGGMEEPNFCWEAYRPWMALLGVRLRPSGLRQKEVGAQQCWQTRAAASNLSGWLAGAAAALAFGGSGSLE